MERLFYLLDGTIGKGHRESDEAVLGRVRSAALNAGNSLQHLPYALGKESSDVRIYSP